MTITIKDDLAFINGKLLGHVMNPWVHAELQLASAERNPAFNKFGNQFPYGLDVTSYADHKMTELMYKARIMQSLGIPINLSGINVMMNESTTPSKHASAPAKEYTQVLLNATNKEKCKAAAMGITGGFEWSESPEGHRYWEEIYQRLLRMSEYGTNDGSPPVKVEPAIEDGYRKATKDDTGRPDRELWYSNRKIWMQAEVGTFDTDIYYQVPEDRIPTDEDAKGRPTVFARDSEGDDWKKVELMRVWSEERGYRFHCDVLEDDEHENYAFCRFPYPGELDED